MFGLLNKPTSDLGEEIRVHLNRCASKRRKLVRPTTEEFPLKRLRSNLAHIMAVDVIFQPVGFDKAGKYQHNPIWDMAPNGAYYKAKRLCSLLHVIVTSGVHAPIVHDCVRLAINIWRMTKKSFDGLCRRIRSKIVKAPRALCNRKSPDALERFRTLSTNPILSDGVYWYTGYQQRKGDGDPTVQALLASHKLGKVRLGQRLQRRIST